MRKARLAATILAMTALDSANQFGHYLDNPIGLKPYRTPEPKNKHNLSDEQIEQMQTMTPKEKKAFLKGIK